MVKLIYFIVFLLCASRIYSQNALDFKMTDSNGNKWHLFKLLDEGNTVLLDFFYADCVPCQSLTPQIADIFQDYGNGMQNLKVLGISDRDPDSKIMQFDSTYGSNYPSCGIEGNGDSITQAYASWFTFIGWPVYAVVCPNKHISWNLDRALNGLPEIRNTIDSCLLFNSLQDVSNSNDGIKLVRNNGEITIANTGNISFEVEIFDMYGQHIHSINEIHESGTYSISNMLSTNSMYILVFRAGTTEKSYKIIVN